MRFSSILCVGFFATSLSFAIENERNNKFALIRDLGEVRVMACQGDDAIPSTNGCSNMAAKSCTQNTSSGNANCTLGFNHVGLQYPSGCVVGQDADRSACTLQADVIVADLDPYDENSLDGVPDPAQPCPNYTLRACDTSVVPGQQKNCTHGGQTGTYTTPNGTNCASDPNGNVATNPCGGTLHKAIACG